ncbi:uncharacterized protein LOC129568587 isoform X2 [Sitodiplosis mosellana]|uniref:uncharacterized protein LOC129568587 isoform X2 n=1 Tax=Sitodiplosis mosellana TaxID=263140 RepID=UPI002444BEBF|nr:uncharacterized protein LOC129568587 isoform X2 [Sitodiplosis mosellana]
MENIDDVDTSPATPKKRYSCTSEYATPRESDDSDNSLYYSFVDDNVLNKENSVNSGLWTITDASNSPIAPRVSKAKTPLLRKVLQTNHTPRNRNNKRVSFSHLSKPSPTPAATVKIAKTKDLESEALNSDRNVTFDLKPIEESLPIISNKEQEECESVAESSTIDESVLSDVTDDLESELHNTIIENPPSASEYAIPKESCERNNSEEHATSVHTAPVSHVSGNKSPVTPLQAIELSESNGMHSSPHMMTDLLENVTPQLSTVSPQLSNENTVTNIRTVEEIIEEARKNIPQTRNAVKINRQQLANDNRKSILPIAKKATRATSYKRRSSTYEPRKVDPRKSLGVLKQIANKVTKTIGVQKNVATTANSTTNHVSGNMVSNSTQSLKITSAKQPSKKSEIASRMSTVKSRQTVLSHQPPRIPIVSTTRQSISTSVRSQRRETKYSLTTLAVAKASTSSNLSNSSSLNQAIFIKPNGEPVRSRSKISASNMPTSNGNGNGNGKCQYCDKFFAKNHGMMTHLLEKCEKIPASARRALNEKNVDDFNSKQVFFVSVRNEDASGMRGDGGAAIDVENGLKNLRAELRKIKRPHTGITRTPSKAIRCHICKMNFFDCVEYADHSISHLSAS